MKGVSLHCLSQRTNWETRPKPIYIWWCIHMHKIFILWNVFHFLSQSKYGCQKKSKGQQDKSQFFWNKYIHFLSSLSCIVNFCDFLCLTFKLQHELSIPNMFHSYMICVDKLYAHSNFACLTDMLLTTFYVFVGSSLLAKGRIHLDQGSILPKFVSCSHNTFGVMFVGATLFMEP
jgi:hypothetical protein